MLGVLAILGLGLAMALPSPALATTLTHVPGSTVKVEQLIGDFDKQKQAATANLTAQRYAIEGTDLGYSFEHQGKLYFLFGDTISPGRGGDPIGVSASTDPERGLRLDFLLDATGKYLRVTPPGLNMGPFNVPVSGISLGGKMYVVVRTDHAEPSPPYRSVLTVFDGRSGFTPLRTLSRLPAGRVINMSLHAQPEAIAGLPPGGPHVLIWSSGVHRQSDAYLSVVPAASFESGNGTRYFAGLGNGGAPIWSDKEADAKPVVQHPTIGDISVTWAAPLRLWLLTYDSRDPRGTMFRYAAAPWGPWSDAQIIFNPASYQGPPFIHVPRRDNVAGPVTGGAVPETTPGGAYAPYVIERFTKVADKTLTIYYVLSTWNPYTVVLMRAMFAISS
jgi:hypothetical protein